MKTDNEDREMTLEEAESLVMMHQMRTLSDVDKGRLPEAIRLINENEHHAN